MFPKEVENRALPCPGAERKTQSEVEKYASDRAYKLAF
jgi:hypothetical protein